MPKPICVIKVDNRKLPFPEFKLQEIFGVQLSDYHVIVVPFAQSDDEPYEPIRFEVFYDRDFKEIDLPTLQEVINNYLNSYTNSRRNSL